LHIAYFSNQFADLEGHGLARYSRELFEAIIQSDSNIDITPCASWSSLDAHAVKELQKRTGLKFLPWGRRWTPLAWAFLDNPPIENWLDKSVDVVHAVSLGYPIATRKPYVVTIHDIGPLTHPGYFTNTTPWIMKQSLNQALSKADAIICVSQSTADELEMYAGQDLGDRIRIVPEGVAALFFEESSPECLKSLKGLPAHGIPFILAAGKISPRKNVAGIIQAFDRLRDIIPHHLVLVGASGWDMDEVQKSIQDTAVANRVHFTGYVTDEQLRTLYSLASLYVHPSLYEGFGLTVLEAMASGCPVVTSNVYSLPEVAGDGALLVDPYSVDAIAEAIRLVCLDSSFASNLAERGLARASGFTWMRCAEQVVEIYRSVV